MAPSTCCMRRYPPSPDGLAPRPAPHPEGPDRGKASESNLPSFATASCFSKPEDIIDLQAIIESDKSSTTSVRRIVQSKQSSNTLKSVRKKLKKHLSRESGVAAKRLSRSSIGNSEEEIERRAELRRIRHKRIEEELSSDAVYDEDAVSIPSVIGVYAASTLIDEAAWEEQRRHLSFTSLSTPVRKLPRIEAVVPKLGVPAVDMSLRYINSSHEKGHLLESRFYGLTSWDNTPLELTPKPRSDSDIMEWSETLVGSSEIRSRRFSFPAPISPKFEIPEPLLRLPSGCHTPDLTVPRSLIVAPQRLPSIAETTKSSWRLSFCSQNRGEHLRKLSQGSVAKPEIAGLSSIGPQPLSKWLRSQGLRSLSKAAATSDSGTNLELSASHLETCSATKGFGGVDGIGDASQAIHLHEMGISQRLASNGLQSPTSSPQPSNRGSHQRGCSAISGDSLGTHGSRHRNLQNTSESIPLSHRIPKAWGQILEDGTSSVYPSNENSIQPSPKSSRFDLLSLLSKNKSISDADEAERSNQMHSPELSTSDIDLIILDHGCAITPSTLPTTISTGSLSLPVARYRRYSTGGGASSAVSETDSYRQRETELIAVQARFQDLELRCNTSTPRSSKFREEFTWNATLAEQPTPVKKYSFSRLAKVVRGYDGSMEDMLGVPLPPSVLSPLPETPGPKASSRAATTHLNPLADKDVAGAWGKAVYLNTHGKSKDVAANFKVPGKGAKKKSHSSEPNRKSSAGIAAWGLKSGEEEEEISEYDKLMAQKEEAMDDWEREMAKTAEKAKAKSRAIVQKAKLGPDRRYPATWSRFPSFDRDERASSAGKADSVARKDFAIQSVKDGRTVWYHSERKHHLYHHAGDDHESHKNEKKRGFLARLGDTFRERMDLIDPGDHELVENQTSGRRGSLTLSGTLEYPELEILPMEIMSHEEIEQHVEDVLEEEELQRKEDELDAMFGGGPKKKIAAKPDSHATSPLEKTDKDTTQPKRNRTSKNTNNFVENGEPKPRRKGKNVAAMMGDDGRTPKGKGKNVADMMEDDFKCTPTGQATERMGRDSRTKRRTSGRIDVGGPSASNAEEVEARLAMTRKATEKMPSGASPKPTPQPAVDVVDTAGMNTNALDEQITARLALKKKMEAAQKSGVRRGPVAKKKLDEPATSFSANVKAAPVEAPKTGTDGSMDFDEEGVTCPADKSPLEDCERSNLSFTDPKFYEDCIVHQIDISDAGSEENYEANTFLPQNSKKDKFRTWSGRDRAEFKYSSLAIPAKRVLSIGDMNLRKSTDEFQCELEKMEKWERENALRSADEAWGYNH